MVEKIKRSIEKQGVTAEKLRDILRISTDREDLLYVRNKRREIGGKEGLDLIYQLKTRFK